MTAKNQNPSSPEAARTPKARHGFCVERLVRRLRFHALKGSEWHNVAIWPRAEFVWDNSAALGFEWSLSLGFLGWWLNFTIYALPNTQGDTRSGQSADQAPSVE